MAVGYTMPNSGQPSDPSGHWTASADTTVIASVTPRPAKSFRISSNAAGGGDVGSATGLATAGVAVALALTTGLTTGLADAAGAPGL